jgi:hypothetical protein
MARARNIKPGFFKNEELGDAGVEAAYFFSGLWCQADRDGIVEYRPKRLKIEICPYWDWDVEAIIKSLEITGLVRCYSSKGFHCIEIVNFKKHQNPHHKESISDLPRPDADASYCSVKSHVNTGQASDKPSANPADSLNPITDSLNPNNMPKSIDSGAFDLFWKNYPRKVGKKKAKTAFNNLTKANQAKATEDCKTRYEYVEKNYIPHPTTYIHGEHWEDEPMPKPKQSAEPWAKIPHANDDLWPWAQEHGYSSPGTLTYPQYRQKLIREVSDRLDRFDAKYNKGA